jgi:thiopeptide-type bacteriocin biosynthesis protein
MANKGCTMPLRTRSLENPDRLYQGLERIVEDFVSGRSVEVGSQAEYNLSDIVEQAGAAICRIIERAADSDRWLYLRISVDANTQDKIVSDDIAPLLEQLRESYPIKGWWWLYKHDPLGSAVRLRVAVPASVTRDTERAIGARLAESGRDVKTLCYEPELRLFGGAEGIKTAHEFFCKDSEFLARWAQGNDLPRHPIIPEGLSLALIIRLLTASGLDLFECWDVFDRVCDKRRVGDLTDIRFAKYQQLAANVLRAAPDQVFQLFRGERAQLLREYRTFVEAFGQKASRIYFNGGLECGLREFFVPIILFHWNRVGFAPFTHFGLSHSVAQELARLTRKGITEA